ncbi:fasciclin domain-containing protein [Dokdonia sp. Hel_I_53]|uniref:fasciclin domain-containing protein n=1 Tax=Dokdonia sp. Hel_I_53 TaxID=1566287 RepID=UPI001199E6AA|nr:fasciclin domain-containing protein [Dokdonia sp. Hel_I_53]TVZ51426.1 fasciclin domain-containing protein [Dokdonia sp. Hel_I_53]
MPTIKPYIILITLLILFTSCDKEKRKKEIRREAQKEIVLRDSINAELKSAIIEQEFRDSSITSKLSEIKSLSILNESIEITGLKDTLQDTENLTVFAPTDKAFMKMPRKQNLTISNKKKSLAKRVRYHIVGDNWSSKDMTAEINSNDGELNMVTLSGKKLAATLEGDDIILQDNNGKKATIIESDIDASNGTIHIVDAVLFAH